MFIMIFSYIVMVIFFYNYYYSYYYYDYYYYSIICFYPICDLSLEISIGSRSIRCYLDVGELELMFNYAFGKLWPAYIRCHSSNQGATSISTVVYFLYLYNNYIDKPRISSPPPEWRFYSVFCQTFSFIILVLVVFLSLLYHYHYYWLLLNIFCFSNIYPFNILGINIYIIYR